MLDWRAVQSVFLPLAWWLPDLSPLNEWHQVRYHLILGPFLFDGVCELLMIKAFDVCLSLFSSRKKPKTEYFLEVGEVSQRQEELPFQTTGQRLTQAHVLPCRRLVCTHLPVTCCSARISDLQQRPHVNCSVMLHTSQACIVSTPGLQPHLEPSYSLMCTDVRVMVYSFCRMKVTNNMFVKPPRHRKKEY